jgi:hypothetical protein
LKSRPSQPLDLPILARMLGLPILEAGAEFGLRRPGKTGSPLDPGALGIGSEDQWDHWSQRGRRGGIGRQPLACAHAAIRFDAIRYPSGRKELCTLSKIIFLFIEKFFSYCWRRHRSSAATMSGAVVNHLKLNQIFLHACSLKNREGMVLGANFALIILDDCLSIGNLPVSNNPLGTVWIQSPRFASHGGHHDQHV